MNSILVLSLLFVAAMAAYVLEEKKLGEPYREYQRRSSRLFPGLW